MPEQDRFMRGMIAWIGYRQEAYEYERNPRYAGTTKYPLEKMISFALDAMSSFSMKPLRIAIYIGALLTTGVTLVGMCAVMSWILSGTVAGWTSLTLQVVIISSLQLIVHRADRGIYRPHLYGSEEPAAVLISHIQRRGRLPHGAADGRDDLEQVPLMTLLAQSK